MAPMGSALRILAFNPMFATGPRMSELLQATHGADALLLAGTRETCRRGGGVLRRRLEGRLIIESVYQKAPLSNSSTGCAVCLGRAYREKDIVQTWAAPVQCAGRGVAVRVKRGAQDLVLGSLYFPPQPSKKGQAGSYYATVQALIRWWNDVLNSLPSRTLPIFYSDLNDGMGLSKIAGQWEEVVSSAIGKTRGREQRRRGAGEEVRKLLDQHGMCAPATFRAREYTYFSCTNPSRPSMIDYLYLPQGYHERVIHCHTLRTLGAQVQAVRGLPPRDHVPLYLEVQYVKDPRQLPPPAEPRMNTSALMMAVRYGHGKAAFLRDLAAELESNEEQLLELTHTGAPDQVFEAYERTFTTVGLRHFQRAPLAPHSDDCERRRELLKIRRDMKASKEGKSEEEVEEIERKLRRLSNTLKSERRKSAKLDRDLKIELIEEAWRERRMADAMQLSRKAAKCRFGAKQRDGRRLGPALLDAQEWEEYMSRAGGQGGMATHTISWDTWRAQRDNLVPPVVSVADESSLADLAAEDYAAIRKYCRKGGKRRVVPPGTAPLELWDMFLTPLGKHKHHHGVGYSDPIPCLKSCQHVFHQALLQIRRCDLTPLYWHRSRGIGLYKND
eukprot:9472008-Pyramimonas_sp.AAC.1